MASLYMRLLGGEPQEQQHLLTKDEVVIGRAPDCDLVVPSFAASRRHARILRLEDRYYVEDMGSRGGTRVNGPEVGNQFRGRTLLHDQDEIRFPNVVVQFRE
jgi:pSer/pThr/pTyr-binding forkhead associated (FHA) protein